MGTKSNSIKSALVAFRVLIVVTIIATACMMTPKSAHAAERGWNKWGVAPYASSLGDACKNASSAIDGFKMPTAVREHFKEILGINCHGGVITWLTPDMVLKQMWSGGKHPRVMGDVRVGELPVLTSPSGKAYRKGSVAETARALSWTWEYEGNTYTLYLPFVCFNWSWSVAPATSPPGRSALACATVEYTVARGDEVRFAVLARKLLPASACWQLCDGSLCSALPSPCDTCDWIGPKSVIPAWFEPLHTGRYVAQSSTQSLRFPREVMSEYVALCASRITLGQSDSWVVQPSAWKNTSVVSVPYGGQQWPAWGKDDLSKWR